MEKMICFPLLLLFCSLCMAQLQPEEMSVQLQRDNEAQTAKLRELEAKLRELESQKTEVDQLKQQVDQLKKLHQAQTAELLDLKAQTNVTEIQVEALKHNGEFIQVAFSASLLASGEGYVGPFNTDTPLVFRYVVTNIGNAYNPNTGSFFAPVRGAYHFEFYIGAWRLPKYPVAAAWLVKNGANVVTAYQYQSLGFGSSSNGVTLLLEVGDVIFLRQHANTRIYDDGNHLSTFSGHLLFTM